jgi:hypothetical protein
VRQPGDGTNSECWDGPTVLEAHELVRERRGDERPPATEDPPSNDLNRPLATQNFVSRLRPSGSVSGSAPELGHRALAHAASAPGRDRSRPVVDHGDCDRCIARLCMSAWAEIAGLHRKHDRDDFLPGTLRPAQQDELAKPFDMIDVSTMTWYATLTEYLVSKEPVTIARLTCGPPCPSPCCPAT